MIYNTHIEYSIFYSEGACDASNGSSFRAVTYEFDGTRPVLGNHDGNLKLNEQMDVQGFSHKSRQVFEKYHFASRKPMFASGAVLASQNEKKRTRATVPGAQLGNPTQAMASLISQARWCKFR